MKRTVSIVTTEFVCGRENKVNGRFYGSKRRESLRERKAEIKPDFNAAEGG